jgi:FkbH-like protein
MNYADSTNHTKRRLRQSRSHPELIDARQFAQSFAGIGKAFETTAEPCTGIEPLPMAPIASIERELSAETGPAVVDSLSDLVVLRNIAPGRECSQSSRDPRWSNPGDDATTAVAGRKDGNYSFHTVGWEPGPWWKIDLGEPTAIDYVVIYNREAARERAVRLLVQTSDDDQTWKTVFDNFSLPESGRVFGGIQTGPRVVPAAVTARFVRLTLPVKQIFHLDTIEIYAKRSATLTEALTEAMEQMNTLNDIVALANLNTIGLPPDQLVAFIRSTGTALNGQATWALHSHLLCQEAAGEARALVEDAAAKEARIADSLAARIRRVAQSDVVAAKRSYAELARRWPDHPELRPLQEVLQSLEGTHSEQTIKLIIWDLDDTLWDGSLAEGDHVRIKPHRRDFILQSINRGLINSVCSKNDAVAARTKLAEFGLLDALTVPVIAFRPKGKAIKNLIEMLALREQNVLFVDDNPANLNEAKFFCPRLQVLDANDPQADVFLEQLLEKSKIDFGKRHERYKVLSSKISEAEGFSGSHEDFLRQSEIKIALVVGVKNLKFTLRIEDLVNRSNQMNFLKTRIPTGTASYLVGNFGGYDSCSVFVRDRYGSYGLVGFAVVEIRAKKLIHFAFSCRIMNMNVENVVLRQLEKRYGPLAVPVESMDANYIRIVDARDPEFSTDFCIAATKGPRDILVMANCQSGIIAHYLGMANRADAEQWPEVFTLDTKSDHAASYVENYHILIYGLFNEYKIDYWKEFTLDSFGEKLDRTLAAWSVAGKYTYLIVPPDDDSPAIETGDAAYSYADINKLVRRISRDYCNVHLVEVAKLLHDKNDMSTDLRHYDRDLQRQIGEYIGEQINSGEGRSSRWT